MAEAEFLPPQSYSQEEMQEILHLAITRQIDRGEITREHLLEVAAELDIDSKDLIAAERDWYYRKKLDRKQEEFDRYRREELKSKAFRYAIINTFAISLNFVTAGTLSWAWYILLLLGLPLTLDSWITFNTKGDAYQKAFQRWKLKNEVKESFVNVWTYLKKVWQASL